MKDRQVEQSPPQLRIPFLSATLHCISMTAIVALRSSFGYAYLRPKSVFFAFSWAFVLFFIYAWNEPRVWPAYRVFCLSGAVVVALYVIHLATAFFRELYRNGEHDNYSGTPHGLRIIRWSGKAVTPLLEMNWHIWFEPALILLAALMLRFLFAEQHLSTWLFVVAPCLSFKEALNFWFQIRHKKRHRDSREDATDIFEDVPNTPDLDPPKAARKEKVKRERSRADSAGREQEERQYAQLLRMMPPYSLEQAEQNYRTLIKEAHPDANQGTDESNSHTASLNQAIEYFRQSLS